ncbi:MAG TPA: hypothetical protein DEE98_04855 [Elusimicrobia bacterium]|nr:MAG: hypothetical protein A2278_04540 [Elusimicrobia bacterium RIFOXYA12_FULL_49_49]OGS09304.1 MAG: hypothetical protein A2204_06770 [Elusimicrobia bacterium RIFOXYA1_FULL_47_7]OGS14686.1 MAG: hypothetical protein A2251_09300 [Elusimicrobia bacterium RIFOXYA2_FULL_47_53]OGS25662.1 MAG: hypothetical protein A2339_06290 [Elusimicrobia bacterium RIFOXYB12_FULL_50_12]OGS31777.1 MAG: hypothetical protein A2323_06210 [Elusimicrobia bacterium RIFOXYB2_FULL_46_23]HBU69693.1 hypothetical protein [El
MKISKIFRLNKTQLELDFIDIDLGKDIPLFIDPYYLGKRVDLWSINANRTVRDFFQTFIDQVRAGNHVQAKELFLYLHEPNETRLGLSRKEPMGKGIGTIDAEKIFKSLSQSKAVKTGLIQDIEDCRIFIEGIDRDKVSDMTTNIIKQHLIEYTQSQCKLWGIPLTSNIQSGDFWDKVTHSWDNILTDMLVVRGEKILLVPKSVVSFKTDYTPQQYYRHFVLNFLQNEHLRLHTHLVQKHEYKNGETREFVTKKSIMERDSPYSKEFVISFTQKHPEIFRNFKKNPTIKLKPHKTLYTSEPKLVEIIDHLVKELKNIPSGPENATKYHRAITGILELIFHPQLTSPQIEKEINDGRKRIDITFDNAATFGFFHYLPTTHGITSIFILVECKNYSRDINNPELDQMAGRFSPNRGKFGFVVCRKIDNLKLFIQGCNDTYKENRGVIIPLVDDDLINILENIKNGVAGFAENLIKDRFREIAIN